MGRYWTEQENDLIKKLYGEIEDKYLLDRVNCVSPVRRTVNALRNQVVKLGLSTKGNKIKWNKEQIDFLTKNYDRLSCADLSTELRKLQQNEDEFMYNRPTILNKLKQLGLEKDGRKARERVDSVHKYIDKKHETKKIYLQEYLSSFTESDLQYLRRAWRQDKTRHDNR